MTSPVAESWDAPLRRAARGGAEAGVETLHGARPALLNAQTAGALTSAVLAAFVCAAARFRTELAVGQLDLIASLLRTAALAFVVRAAIDAAISARTLWCDRVASSAYLSLAASGLALRVGERTQSVRREELLGISIRESLPSRTLPARPEPILLTLTAQAGRPRVLEVPPYFAQTSEIALARLLRWRGTRAAPEPEAPPGDDARASPEAHYARAARGELAPDDLVIPEGRGYLLRAPYSALLALVFALDMFVSAGTSRALIATPVLGACTLSLAALVSWFLWMARRRKSRGGIGMLCTRDELLLRGPRGVVAIPWPELASTELKVSPRWSPFVGTYAARTLVLSTHTGERMLFDQSFVGVPLEAVAVLCRKPGEPALKESAARP